jgi:hypothetical protein
VGGRGSGGARAGAGRKPKELAAKILEGSASPRQQARSLPKVEEFDAPNDLTRDERLVWLDLAPHAFQSRTLNRATSYSFRMLCRNIVLEREIAADAEQRGGANHRGIIQRVDAELLRFCLSPIGKPIVSDEKPADEWAEFDGETVQ